MESEQAIDRAPDLWTEGCPFRSHGAGQGLPTGEPNSRRAIVPRGSVATEVRFPTARPDSRGMPWFRAALHWLELFLAASRLAGRCLGESVE